MSNKEIKFYQASSSEMYGGASRERLNESSPFDPKSPYAASKVFAPIFRDGTLIILRRLTVSFGF